MDEMKIGSKFTTSIISKLASLAIRKKFGYDVKLNWLLCSPGCYCHPVKSE